MSKRILSVLMTVCVIFSTFTFNVFAQNEPDQTNKESFKTASVSENAPRKPGQLIVKYKNNLSSNANTKNIIKNDGKIVKSDKNGLTLIEVDDRKIIEKIDALKQDKNVEYVVPNYIRRAVEFPADAPNDPEFINQWGLQNINAQQAWAALGEESSLTEVKVAVIDTGIDMQHEDLKDRISSDGYDFVDMDSDPTYGPFNEEHASHVAGIIAATTDNAMGVAGTGGKAPIKIMPLRVLDAGSGDDYTISQAIHYAVDNGARVINMSLGGPMESPLLNEAVNYALSKNVVVVAAAGNSYSDAANFHPGAIPGVITVSATDSSNTLADFSNYGSVVELAAPGVNILSTVPGNKYEYHDGTSMSAPFVSAACALLISRNPSLSNIEVEQYLTDSAKDIGTAGKDESFGYGLLDLAKAMTTTEIKPRLEIMNLSDNAIVFDLVNIQTRFTYPKDIVTMDLLVDNSVVQSVYNDSNYIFYNFEIDTNKYKDGIHNLKVVARDKWGQSYSKEIKINIRNTIYTGLRVKLTQDGTPVAGGMIEVWNKHTEANGKTYYDFVYFGATSKSGIAVIPGTSAPNGNTYVIVASYALPEGEGSNGAFLIKEATAPGIVEMDGKDLVQVSVDTGLTGANQAVFATYKFPGSNVSFQYFMSYVDSSGEFETWLSPGTYSFEAFKYNSGEEGEDNEPYYLLKTEDIEIDSGNFFVTMDSDIDNLSKIDLSYENIHGFIPQNAYFSIGSKDSTISNSISITDFDGITQMYLTPGNYSYNFDIIGQKDRQKAYIAFEGSIVDLDAGDENAVTIGGTFTGKIKTDKTKFIPGEELPINASITDSQGNKLLYMEYIYDSPFEKLAGKNVVSYKKSMNKVGFKVVDTSYKALEEPLEPVEIEYKSPATVELLDSVNNVVATAIQFSIDHIYLVLPQNLATGNYKLKMIVELPYLIQAETALNVSRVIKKDAVKLNIGLPGKNKATRAQVDAVNTKTGEIYYCSGQDLLNGEMFIAVPKGNYKFIVSTVDSEGKPVLYIKDVVSPAEYDLNPSDLQNVKFSVKDEEEKIINKLSAFYFSMPYASTTNTYMIGYNLTSAELNFYINKGTYNFWAEVITPEIFTTERVIFKGNTVIGLKSNNLQTIDFTSDNLTEVSLDSRSDVKSIGVTVKDPKTGFGTWLMLQKGNSAKISKGLYNLNIICDKSEYGNQYTYYMTSQKDFSGAKTSISCGTDFSISTTPNKTVYKKGEVLKTKNEISDRFGNKVVEIVGNSVFGFMSEKIKASKGLLKVMEDQGKLKFFDMASKEYEEIPFYDIRAPFMYIKDSYGNVVFSSKSPDYYTSSQIKLDPTWANSGDYKIQLTVDIDADGDLSALSSFRIK
jgi:subtilisin family serine protease